MKIGIYGGTFDPPHNGHVHACKTFYNAFDMDKLVVIPNAIPPHKQQKSNVDQFARLEMAKLAFENIGNKIEVSEIELKRAGKSYTKDTIKYFLENEVDEILLLCGTDMFITFDTWMDFQFIFDNATIVCIRRENNTLLGNLINQKAAEYKEKYNAKIEIIDTHVVEISSDEIRKNIMSVEVKNFLPKSVYDFIIERGLYR